MPIFPHLHPRLCLPCSLWRRLHFCTPVPLVSDSGQECGGRLGRKHGISPPPPTIPKGSLSASLQGHGPARVVLALTSGCLGSDHAPLLCPPSPRVAPPAVGCGVASPPCGFSRLTICAVEFHVKFPCWKYLDWFLFSDRTLPGLIR